jgi:hypothetical protein
MGQEGRDDGRGTAARQSRAGRDLLCVWRLCLRLSRARSVIVIYTATMSRREVCECKVS